MGPHTRGMGGKVRKFFSEETDVDVNSYVDENGDVNVDGDVDVDGDGDVNVNVDGVEEADAAETHGDEAGVVVDGDDVNCDAVGVRE